MQAVIEFNKQNFDEKMLKLKEDLTEILAAITDHINTMKSLPTKKDSPKPLDPTIAFLVKRKDPPLDGGQSTKIDGMWNLKHDISSPKYY